MWISSFPNIIEEAIFFPTYVVDVFIENQMAVAV
jgi:hypothetical protein